MKIKIDTDKDVIIDTCIKVRDYFTARFKFTDQDGVERSLEYDGYVPSFMPGDHYGDYLELKIDAKTGQILNWRNVKHVLDDIQELVDDHD